MWEKIRGALILGLTIIFSLLAIVLSTLEYNSILGIVMSYATYCLAMFFIIVETWVLVQFFRKATLKKRLSDVAHRTEITARIYDDFTFRTIMSGHLSMLMNLFFVLTKAVAGWYYSSSWLCVLALYYLVLCVIKAIILQNSRKRRNGEKELDRLQREWKIYRLCGILLLLMMLTLQGIIILIVEQGKTFFYYGTLIFVVAMYDFYCLISSIVYMVRTRKKHTPVVVSIKTINFATSLVAMLALQTAMFASFGHDLDIKMQQMMNIMTGTGICVILIVWGTVMICRSQKELKKIRAERL